MCDFRKSYGVKEEQKAIRPRAGCHRAVSGAGYYAVRETVDDTAATAFTYPPVKVALASAQRSVATRVFEGVGELESGRQVMVAAETGGRITQIAFNAGQWVEEDELLVQLNGTVEQAELVRLKAQQRNEQTVYARTRRLAAQNAATQEQQDKARAERELAASVEDVGAATAALYPRLDLAGFIGFFALCGTDLGSASHAFELAPGAIWRAFRLGNARARLRGVQPLAQGAEARYEQAMLLAVEETKNAVTQLAEHPRRLAALMRAAGHGAPALELATARYQAGAQLWPCSKTSALRTTPG